MLIFLRHYCLLNVLLGIFIIPNILKGQTKIRQNVRIFSGGKMCINEETIKFERGFVVTNRATPESCLRLGLRAEHAQASDSSHVNGYLEAVVNQQKTLPLGNGRRLSLVGVKNLRLPSVVRAAYFSGDPNRATLPNNGYFYTDSKDENIDKVCRTEFWDVNGDTEMQMVLNWTPENDLTRIPSDSNYLTVVGWDGGRWVNIGREGLDFQKRTITSAAVVPNQFSVYTLAIARPLDVELVLYPNPTPDVVNIRFKQYNNEPITIEVLNEVGQSLIIDKTERLPRNMMITINLADFADAAFLFKIFVGNRKPITQKVILTK